MSHRVFFGIVMSISISGCASPAADIAANYVDPTIYKNHTCAEIISEKQRISEQSNTLAVRQNKKATNDAVGMTVGMLVFWPALFLLSAGTDNEVQIADLKGRHDAIEKIFIQKNC